MKIAYKLTFTTTYRSARGCKAFEFNDIYETQQSKDTVGFANAIAWDIVRLPKNVKFLKDESDIVMLTVMDENLNTLGTFKFTLKKELKTCIEDLSGDKQTNGEQNVI